MQIADTAKAKAHLASLLDDPLAGDEVIVARSGRRSVRLTPLERFLRPRHDAPLRSKLWVAEEFDDAAGAQ